jgi:hypothetical protein
MAARKSTATAITCAPSTPSSTPAASASRRIGKLASAAFSTSACKSQLPSCSRAACATMARCRTRSPT